MIVIILLLLIGVAVYRVMRQQSAATPTTAVTAPPEENALSYETIALGSYSGHEDKKDHVITTQSEWRQVWSLVNKNLSPKPPLPPVDFSKEMVIGVFMGTQSTGGYSITIKKVIEHETSLEVVVEETAPKAGQATTQALTQPFHIIKTIRIDKPVTFTRVSK